MAGQFREARDRKGNLAFLEAAEERAILDTMPRVAFNDVGELAQRRRRSGRAISDLPATGGVRLTIAPAPAGVESAA